MLGPAYTFKSLNHVICIIFLKNHCCSLACKPAYNVMNINWCSIEARKDAVRAGHGILFWLYKLY